MAQGLWPALRRLDWTYIFFIALVTVTQLMLATWGILARYLQTKPTEPTPPLRLVFIVSTLAETTLLLFHTLPTTAAAWYRRRWPLCAALPKAERSAGSSGGGGDESSSSSSPGGSIVQAVELPGKSPAAPPGKAAAAAGELGLDGAAVDLAAGLPAGLPAGEPSVGGCSRTSSLLAAVVPGGEAAAGAAELLAAGSEGRQWEQQQQQGERCTGPGADELPLWQAPAAVEAASGACSLRSGQEAGTQHATAAPAAAAGAAAAEQAVAARAAPSAAAAALRLDRGSAVGATATITAALHDGGPGRPSMSAAGRSMAADPGEQPVEAHKAPAHGAGAAAAAQGAAAGPLATGPGLAASGGSARPPLPGLASSSWGSLRSLAGKLRPRPRRQPTLVRPEVPLRRGLSVRFEALEAERPRLYRYLALGTLTVSFSATCGLQLCAPGFVDPSLVQLVSQFTAIGTALAQAALLRHRLPWQMWPCGALMTGGAAMVIVPSLGHTEAGSLATARGWLGFGMAVVALITTVVYFVTLQASRHLGYSATQLQHYFLSFSILVFLVLTLPVDGTNWTEQFRGWTAGDWVLLAFESSIAYVGSAAAMQHCVWRLGAPMVSLFMGLRLVFTVVMTKPILGASIIQTGVQVAGVVITAGSVTSYVGWQWWLSRNAA